MGQCLLAFPHGRGDRTSAGAGVAQQGGDTLVSAAHKARAQLAGVFVLKVQHQPLRLSLDGVEDFALQLRAGHAGVEPTLLGLEPLGNLLVGRGVLRRETVDLAASDFNELVVGVVDGFRHDDGGIVHQLELDGRRQALFNTALQRAEHGGGVGDVFTGDLGLLHRAANAAVAFDARKVFAKDASKDHALTLTTAEQADQKTVHVGGCFAADAVQRSLVAVLNDLLHAGSQTLLGVGAEGGGAQLVRQ